MFRSRHYEDGYQHGEERDEDDEYEREEDEYEYGYEDEREEEHQYEYEHGYGYEYEHEREEEDGEDLRGRNDKRRRLVSSFFSSLFWESSLVCFLGGLALALASYSDAVWSCPYFFNFDESN